MAALLQNKCQFLGAVDEVLCYLAPSKAAADRLVDDATAIARYAVEKGVKRIELYWLGCDRPYQFESSFAAGMPSSRVLPSFREFRGKINPELDLDWRAIAEAENPVYISSLVDQRNLYANNVAILTQGKKPQDFLSDRAYSLNDPDELARRCKLLQYDGGLIEYEYSALRWCRDDAGLWRRKRMNFTSTFLQVCYLGEPCWMGEVLETAESGEIY